MPRKSKKLSTAEQAAREAEMLGRPINPSGEGEPEAIKALMSPEFEKMSNLDAAQVALLLQEIVRGQNSLLANYEQTNVQIARIMERQDQVDREIAERMEEQKKFVEDVLDRAESLKRTGEAQDKLIAQGLAQYEQARQTAVAKRATKNLAFRETLKNEPKVVVISPGQLVTTMDHGHQVTKIIPEEVRIADLRWVLPPGIPVEVPQTVAGVLEQRRASQIETHKRAELLGKNLEATKLAEEWSKVGGSKTEPMPL
jgi:paraquat-inducible protein B